MSIATADCKAEIVNAVIADPSIVEDQFDDGESADPAKLVKNWKRIFKEKMGGGNTMRIFDCLPYEGQLRAYVVDNGTAIISVDICGE